MQTKGADNMIRVQFNGDNSVLRADFKIISPSVVQLTGEKIPRSEAGFKTYRLNGDFLGDYSEYTKIVAEVDGGFRFGKPEK
jgi:hypothetical protein